MPAKKTQRIQKDLQYIKFCGYGFFKNLRLYEPFLVLFFLSNQLTFLQIGLLYTIREITRNVLEIPAGIISDSMGRRKTMIASFGFYILSFLIFYSQSTFAFFVLAMLVYALGDAFRTGTHKAMIFDYLTIRGWENQKAAYYGHTRSFSQLGSAISSLVGGFMVFYTGNYRDIFIYTAVPYFIDLILVASYPKSLDGARARFDGGRIRENMKKVFFDFIRSFGNLNAFRIVGNLSLHTGYYRAFKDYLQPVLQALAVTTPVLLFLAEKQRTAVIVGSAYFLIYLLSSFASRKSGALSRRFGEAFNKPLNLTLMVGFLAGITCGIFVHYNFLLLGVLFYLLIFMNENLRKPIGIANVAEGTNKDILATTLSAESQLQSLLTALLAPAIGWLADFAGLGIAIFGVSMAMLLLSPLFMLRKGR